MSIQIITLNSDQFLLALAALTLVLLGSIHISRLFFSKSTTPTNHSKHRPLRNTQTAMRLGLLISTLFALICTSWTTEMSTHNHAKSNAFNDEEFEVIPPSTADRPPVAVAPPPPPEIVKEIVFADPVPTIEPIVIPQPMSLTTDTISTARSASPPPPPPVPLPEPTAEIPFRIVEEMPRFPGCEDSQLSKNQKNQCAEQALLNFINDKIKYPTLARENNVEGKAIVEFIIEKDGSISNGKIIDSPGAGLGQEALRVVQLMTTDSIIWYPGKQRGRPVRVKQALPITFRLK